MSFEGRQPRSQGDSEPVSLDPQPSGWHSMPIKSGEVIDMPTRNIVLTPHQASFVEQLVSSGRYQNASEVLREGLRLIEQREAEDASRLEALRNAVQAGVADFDAGRFTTFESSDALGTHLKSVAAKAIADT